MVLSWQLIWDMNLLMQLEVIFFDEEGEFDAEKTNEVLFRETGAYRAGSHSWILWI